jgi:hypothetical protein
MFFDQQKNQATYWERKVTEKNGEENLTIVGRRSLSHSRNGRHKKASDKRPQKAKVHQIGMGGARIKADQSIGKENP